MTEDQSDGGGVDRSVLLRLREVLREQGDDVVQQLLGVFEEEGVKRLETIDQALAIGDVGAVRLCAHTLRGSAQLIGAHRLALLSARLEDAAGAGQLHALAALFGDLRGEYRTVALQLEQERQGRS